MILEICSIISCSFVTLWLWISRRQYKNIQKDVVLITGGGRGLGRQIALELVKYSPKQIILWGRTEGPLSSTSEEIQNQGVACSYMLCDVGNWENVYDKAEVVRKLYGDVTILINNAGVIHGGNVGEIDSDDVWKTIQTNLLGSAWTLKSFLPSMLANSHGHIVSINSVLGLITLAGASDYCASKFGLHGLTNVVAKELRLQGATGVHVSSIHPYQVDNEMFDGCTTRFPWLFPPLTEEYVAKATVEAILTNKSMVILPRMQQFLYIVKSIIPVELLSVFSKYLGVDKSMAGFHGKKSK